MPYVDRETQIELNGERRAETVGELTYQLTLIVDRYAGMMPDFQRLSECVAALECAKQEFYRRVVAPYEDQKRAINGDVYLPRHLIGRKERTR